MKKDLIQLQYMRENLLSELDDLPHFSHIQDELEHIVTIYTEGSLALYICKGEDCPNLMQAIGVEREIAFRMAGGGSGKKSDIDKWDSQGYAQIICVDFETERIVGGYRYILGKTLLQRNEGDQGAVEHLFHLSHSFKREVFSQSLELGRSFVDPTSEKSAAIMDILWYGLGYLTKTEQFHYFLGKVTFYPTRLASNSLDILDYFLEENFGPDDSETTGPKSNCQYIRKPIILSDLNLLNKECSAGSTYPERRRNLFKIFNNKGQSLRPFMLLFKYLSLGERAAKVYGGAINTKFGDVVEVLFTIQLNTTHPQTIERYILPILNFQQR